MSTNQNEENLLPEQYKNPEVDYEHRDLSPRAVFMFLIGLAMVIVVAGLILWGMFRTFGHGNVTPQPSATAISTPVQALPPGGDPARNFPAPQLQPDPTADLNKFRTREEETLNSYGWIDKDHGVVRIPIDRAMQLMEQKGFAVRVPGQPIPSVPPPAAGQPAPATPGAPPAAQ